MKKHIILSIIVLFATASMIFTSCDTEEDPTTGNTSISLVPMSGESVDVNGMNVELHTSATYDALYMQLFSSGYAASASVEMKDILPGTYYLVAWTDNDGSSDFSTGDYFGFQPGAINVAAGDNLSYTIEVYVVD
jgi:hypothetical protein